MLTATALKYCVAAGYSLTGDPRHIAILKGNDTVDDTHRSE
jgi:hypothetical protein